MTPEWVKIEDAPKDGTLGYVAYKYTPDPIYSPDKNYSFVKMACYDSWNYEWREYKTGESLGNLFQYELKYFKAIEFEKYPEEMDKENN